MADNAFTIATINGNKIQLIKKSDTNYHLLTNFDFIDVKYSGENIVSVNFENEFTISVNNFYLENNTKVLKTITTEKSNTGKEYFVLNFKNV